MKYLLLLIALLSAFASAQNKTWTLVVSNPVAVRLPTVYTDESKAVADGLAHKSKCNCRVTVNEAPYAVELPSAKSSSASSNSSAPKLSVVNASCSKHRVNGVELDFDEIGGYDLSCDGRHEKFTQESCKVNYVTSLPLLTKNCELATYDKAGVYSDYAAVVR